MEKFLLRKSGKELEWVAQGGVEPLSLELFRKCMDVALRGMVNS